MTSLNGKVAIVTGASAGIGAAIAEALVSAGMKVVGLARRKELIDKLAKELEGKPGKLYSMKTDISKEEDIIEAFRWTTKNVGPLHVLINNAALIPENSIIDGDTQKWKLMFDTNVLGLTIASREAVKIMMDNKIDGHIVNINSVAGHQIIDAPNVGIYSATKYAVVALTESLRLDLARMGSNIKITSISPGFVESDIRHAAGLMSEEESLTLNKTRKMLKGEDIASGIIYVLETPPHVLVKELTLVPAGMPM